MAEVPVDEMRIRIITLYILAVTCVFSRAQSAIAQDNQARYISPSTLALREAPLLVALMNDSGASEEIRRDAVLAQLSTTRWKHIDLVKPECRDNLTCKLSVLRFSGDEVRLVSGELQRLYKTDGAIKRFADSTLSGNPHYSISGKVHAVDCLTEAWQRTATALNNIIDVYGGGQKARYSEIDSPRYDVQSDSYKALVQIIIDGLRLGNVQEGVPPAGAQPLFFIPTLNFAVRLLIANGRDEAARLWPLDTGENRAAIAKIGSVAWSAYPYSLILVPGAGSEIPNVSLSPWGIERLRVAVEAYRTGKAPFILVSGGFVHPSQTPYCEALEMKRYLLEVYKVPESSILIDPYARHTTTNLRNAVREIVDYHLPIQKRLLIVSDTNQADYIDGQRFEVRNERELGYQPLLGSRRISATAVEALPSLASLYEDSIDPLDP